MKTENYKKQTKAKYQIFPVWLPVEKPAKDSTLHSPINWFHCINLGHWAKACPTPRPPIKPCLNYGQGGHWKMDYPVGKLAPLKFSTLWVTWHIWRRTGGLSSAANWHSSAQSPLYDIIYRFMGTIVVARKQVSSLVDLGVSFSVLTIWDICSHPLSQLLELRA